MAPLKKIYLEELSRIQERINRLFEQTLLPDFENQEGGVGLPGTWSPGVDVVETADAYLLFAELPGVAKEDIQVVVRDGRLEVSGHRRSPGENPHFLRMERSYGPFRRSFDLGGPVDAERLSASFEHGVLKVTLAKRERVVVLVREGH